MQLSIERDSSLPVYRQIVEQVRGLVASAALPVGATLPTVRALAADLQISRLTVHKAYQELQSLGVVECRRRSGTVVCPIQDEEVGLRRLDGFLSSGPFPEFELISRKTNVRSLASPVPDPRLFDVDEFLSCMNVLRGPDNWSFYYPDRFADPALARLLASRLGPYGVGFDPEGVVLLGGRNPGMALLSSTILGDGRPVAVQEPHTLGASTWYGQYGIETVGVRSSSQGLDTDALRRACEERSVGALVAQPNFGPVTGHRWSEANRSEVAEILTRFGVVLIERTGYSVLSFDDLRPTTVASHMPPDLSYLEFSFQAAIAPGMSLSFVCTPPGRTHKVVNDAFKMGLVLAKPDRMVGAEFLRRAFEPNLARIVRTYLSRRDALCESLSSSLPSSCSFDVPEGGYCVYVRLPKPLDPEALFREALRHKVSVMPGRYVWASDGGDDGVALSYSMLDPAALTWAGQAFGRVLTAVL
jgi:DNA-binding transcriptional MocR family regulator